MSCTLQRTSSTETDQQVVRYSGRVKWFNNKSGYGFITVTDGDKSGTDVFVHHSAVAVKDQQYKYLVQGEYVQFTLTPTQSGKHEFNATDVSGINNGCLMCETRHENKINRVSYSSQEPEPSRYNKNLQVNRPPRIQTNNRDFSQSQNEYTPRDLQRTHRARGEGPRDGDKKDWTLADNKQFSHPPKLQRQTTSGVVNR